VERGIESGDSEPNTATRTQVAGTLGLDDGTPTAAAELTQAERAIIELAARGLTNQELASSRGVSERTVANQLTLAYRKLRIAGRRELRAKLGCGVRASVPCPDAFPAGHSPPPLPAPSDRLPRGLSSRERQVLSLVDLGQSNKLIAYSLGLSVSTVSTTLTRARRKQTLAG
jgi:DNA-binding CsgD family transcriptional regulator